MAETGNSDNFEKKIVEKEDARNNFNILANLHLLHLQTDSLIHFVLFIVSVLFVCLAHVSLVPFIPSSISLSVCLSACPSNHISLPISVSICLSVLHSFLLNLYHLLSIYLFLSCSLKVLFESIRQIFHSCLLLEVNV